MYPNGTRVVVTPDCILEVAVENVRVLIETQSNNASLDTIDVNADLPTATIIVQALSDLIDVFIETANGGATDTNGVSGRVPQKKQHNFTKAIESMGLNLGKNLTIGETIVLDTAHITVTVRKVDPASPEKFEFDSNKTDGGAKGASVKLPAPASGGYGDTAGSFVVVVVEYNSVALFPGTGSILRNKIVTATVSNFEGTFFGEELMSFVFPQTEAVGAQPCRFYDENVPGIKLCVRNSAARIFRNVCFFTLFYLQGIPFYLSGRGILVMLNQTSNVCLR